jgi:hypothetical protein
VPRPGCAALLACLPLLAAGCASHATPVPDVTTARAPTGWSPARFESGGLRLHVPANWFSTATTSPQVAAVSSGSATVALWRYPRAEPLPVARPALVNARRALIGAVRRRDRTFRLAGARLVRVAGAPGIAVVGAQSMNGRRVRIRSTHLFAKRSEVVVDAYAPPGQFVRLDRTVFRPLTASVRIDPAAGP